MTFTEYNDLVSNFSKACNEDEIHSFCGDLCMLLGFDYFIYGLRVPKSFVKPHISIISGYPKEWRERYVAQGYLNVDPTVSYCANQSVSLTWDRLKPLEKQNKPISQFMSESRDFGLKSGISFPIHDAQGGRAMLSLVSSKEHDRAYLRITESLPFAHAISFHVHEAARRALNTMKVVLPGMQHLTDRETECLLWTAEGKTSWETSQILGVSERTVIFHLQRVSDKLQVSNRSHAVARAVSLGIIY